MNLAAALIPPALDAKQALRLRRLGLAVLTYALAAALVAAVWASGGISDRATLEIAAVFLAVNLGLYVAVRSGFNLRFKDPSLTFFQVAAGVSVLMFVVYHMGEDRKLALFSCFNIFLFGVFRLDAREFRLLTLYALAAYALVINLLMHLRPEAIDNVQREWMSWLALAGLLPFFAVIGGQVSTVRRRLRESEARFRQTFELAASGIAHVSLEGRFLRVNRSLCGILGYSGQELMQRTVKEISHPEDCDETDAARARVRSDELESARFQKRYLRKDGTTIWVDLKVALVRDQAGKPAYEIAVFDDITERKALEQALRNSADELRLFADNVPAMTVYWDENLRCSFANKVFADFYGLAVEDVIGKHVREILGEAVHEETKGYAEQALQGNPVTYQRTRTLENGELRHLEIKLVPHVGDQGKVRGYFAVTTGITEHKLAEERVQRMAHHDSLTGLPNRLLFNDRLKQAICLARRASGQFALLYLDLDRFKPVNDTLGHAAGDELLKGVAARIRHQVRESDTVARVGGDEFTVILSGVATRQVAEAIATKIVAALAAPFSLGGGKQSVGIGASAGIAVYPADARDADALVKAADDNMYLAKQAGKGVRVLASQGMF